MPAPMLSPKIPHVVILGGGFGGLAAARALGKRSTRGRVRVTLIDRQNHHLFQPLLYQVATAALSAPDIASPIRKLLRKNANTTVLMADVTRIDPKARVVVLRGEEEKEQELAFDHLIVATGMQNAYFGNDAWEANAPGLKTLDEALEIRSRILRAFEGAERTRDDAERDKLLTFVVVGGGATGVELAGALAEIAGKTLARDFRNFDPKESRVVLLEGGPRLLPAFDPKLSEKALLSLRGLGVDVRLNTRVTNVDANGVQIGDEFIPARTTLWAAGLKASGLTAQLGAPLDRAGRVKVNADLTLPDNDRISVLGDLIALEQDGKPLPGVAQTAIQSGELAAANIVASIDGKPRKNFHYSDRGSMATIGRASAIAEVKGLRISGFIAWMMWLFIHVLFLVDFRNRLAVLFEWAWAYLTWQRSSRVILALNENRKS